MVQEMKIFYGTLFALLGFFFLFLMEKYRTLYCCWIEACDLSML